MHPQVVGGAQASRPHFANLVPVGSARVITTTSLPAHGGTTGGDGAHALGSTATVSATANPRYKFSKGLVNGVPASTARNYTFTVTGDRALVANFMAQPALSRTVTWPGTLTLSWPAGTMGWVLQESPDLSPESWHDSTRAEETVNGQKQVSVWLLAGNAFFRLVHP